MAVASDQGVYTRRDSLIHDTNPSLQRLIEVCESGHCSLLRSLLRDDVTVAVLSQLSDDHTTALHEACRRGHGSCVRLLVEAGADGAIKNKRGFAPIHVAAYNGHSEVVKLLLDHEVCEVDFPTTYEETALHLASLRRHRSLVELLVQRQAQVSAQDKAGNTAVHYAAAGNYSECVRLVIQERNGLCNDIDVTNQYGQTALHRAADLGCERSISTLLEFRANPSILDHWSRTALQVAEFAGNSACAALLRDAIHQDSARATEYDDH